MGLGRGLEVLLWGWPACYFLGELFKKDFQKKLWVLVGWFVFIYLCVYLCIYLCMSVCIYLFREWEPG